MEQINKHIILIPLLLLLLADNMFVFIEDNSHQWFIFDLFSLFFLFFSFFIFLIEYKNYLILYLIAITVILYFFNLYIDLDYYVLSMRRLVSLSFFMFFFVKSNNYITKFAVIYCIIEFTQTAILRDNMVIFYENIGYLFLFISLQICE